MHKLIASPSMHDHRKGDLTYPIRLVEYGDYACPHSRKAHRWIKQLLSEFEYGLCYIYRHFPLNDIHPNSMSAALASEFATTENKFWEVHDRLFNIKGFLSQEEIILAVRNSRLSEEEFLRRINDRKFINHVSEDMLSGAESGVLSTPSFFINDVMMEGPISYEIIHENIIRTLEGHSLSA
jgi:protein-disulfide isomerase